MASRNPSDTFKATIDLMIRKAGGNCIQFLYENCVIGNQKIYIKCHHTREIAAKVVGLDKHLNMLLVGAVVKRSAVRRTANKKRRTVKKFRLYKCIFLRGENVIYARPITDAAWKALLEEVPKKVISALTERARLEIFGLLRTQEESVQSGMANILVS